VTQGRKTADTCNQSQLKYSTSYCSQKRRATWEDELEKILQRGNRGTRESVEPTTQTLQDRSFHYFLGFFSILQLLLFYFRCYLL